MTEMGEEPRTSPVMGMDGHVHMHAGIDKYVDDQKSQTKRLQIVNIISSQLTMIS